MGKRSAAGLLTSVDSIFTTQEERDNAQRSYVTDLSAAEISDFPNHPFKVRMDQSMVELADSVKQYGVLVPSLVRPMPDGSYQMVSGHRRKRRHIQVIKRMDKRIAVFFRKLICIRTCIIVYISMKNHFCTVALCTVHFNQRSSCRHYDRCFASIAFCRICHTLRMISCRCCDQPFISVFF